MKKIWIPAPINEVNNFEKRGGLNTSPWTNFQPVSSTVSSYVDNRKKCMKCLCVKAISSKNICHHILCYTKIKNKNVAEATRFKFIAIDIHIYNSYVHKLISFIDKIGYFLWKGMKKNHSFTKSSSLLYWAMSRRKVRTIIIVNIPEMTNKSSVTSFTALIWVQCKNVPLFSVILLPTNLSGLSMINEKLNMFPCTVRTQKTIFSSASMLMERCDTFAL